MANKRDRGARRAARAAGSPRRPPEVALARHLGVDGARLASPWWVACPAGAVVAVAAAQLGVVPRRLAALAAVVDAVESDPAGTVLCGSRCSATLDALAALASATGCVDTSAEGRWVSGWLAGELAWLRWADDAVEPWAPVDAAGPPGGVVAAAAAAALARRGDPALGAWASSRPRWAAAAVTGPAAVALVGPLAAALAAVDADGARRLLDTAARPPTGPEATWLAVTAASRSGVVPASPADADWAELASGGEVWGDEDLEELDEEWDLGVDVAWEARGVTPALVEAMAAALDRWARWLAASSRQPQVKASQWQERWRASDVARLGAGVAAFCAGRHLRAGRHDAAAAVLDRAPSGPYPHLGILRVLAAAGVADAGDIVLPVTWPEREALADRLAAHLAGVGRAVPDTADAWVARQLAVLVALIAVGRRHAAPAARGWALGGEVSASVAYGAALALATFDDGPLRGDLGGGEAAVGARRSWTRVARLAFSEALQEGFAADDAEEEEVARAVGVDFDAATGWAATLTEAVTAAVDIGDGQGVADLAADPALCPTEPPLTPTAAAAVAAVAYDSLVYLATVVDDAAEIAEPVGETDPGEPAVDRDAATDADESELSPDRLDNRDVEMLAGLLAGRRLLRVAEDLIAGIERSAAAAAAAAAAATVTTAAAPRAGDAGPVPARSTPGPQPAPSVHAPVAPTQGPAPTVPIPPQGSDADPSDATALDAVVADLAAATFDAAMFIAALRELGPEPLNAAASARLADAVAARDDRACDETWLAVLDGATPNSVQPWAGGPRRDLEKIHVLARLGRVSEAAKAAEVLAWRVVDAGGCLAGVTVEELQPLLERLGSAVPGRPDHEAPQPVRVLFVGGNEIQARYVPMVEADLARRHQGRVSVEWVHPGWTANWQNDAARAMAAMGHADIAVLMKLMRTNLGAQLRRAASQADIAWVACTGHGRSSLLRAVEHAVTVVDQQRQRPTTTLADPATKRSPTTTP
jgi:hypothetical protein